MLSKLNYILVWECIRGENNIVETILNSWANEDPTYFES
jgi:hypothetical protein